jgi:putative transposase
MQYNLDRGSRSVYSLHYHFVQCIKYRREVLCEGIINADGIIVLV